ncbi:MAG: porin family protein [Telluria sp.]
MIKKSAATLLACMSIAGAAHAGPGPGTPHVYVGAGATAAERTGGSSKLNPKLVGGYAFSDSLGLEAGYVDFRKGPLVGTPAPEARTIDLGGFGSYIAARFTKPLFDKLSAFGKLGVAHSERKATIGGTLRKATDTGAYAGFGLQYAVTQKMAVTAEYERFGKDKPSGAKADAWSLGLKIEF